MNSVNQESTPTQEHYHYTLYSLLFCQGYAQRIATHRQPRSTCQHSFRGKELKLRPGALTSQQLPGNPDQTLHVKPQKLMQFVLYIFVFHMYTHTCVYIEYAIRCISIFTIEKHAFVGPNTTTQESCCSSWVLDQKKFWENTEGGNMGTKGTGLKTMNPGQTTEDHWVVA